MFFHRRGASIGSSLSHVAPALGMAPWIRRTVAKICYQQLTIAMHRNLPILSSVYRIQSHGMQSSWSTQLNVSWDRSLKRLLYFSNGLGQLADITACMYLLQLPYLSSGRGVSVFSTCHVGYRSWYMEISIYFTVAISNSYLSSSEQIISLPSKRMINGHLEIKMLVKWTFRFRTKV